jgi:hypothetical protein
MIIELAVFVAFVVLTGAAIVKFYEWRQNIPLGQHVKRRN